MFYLDSNMKSGRKFNTEIARLHVSTISKFDTCVFTTIELRFLVAGLLCDVFSMEVDNEKFVKNNKYLHDDGTGLYLFSACRGSQ